MKKSLIFLIFLIFFKINLAFSLKIHLFCNMENFHHIKANLEIEKIIFQNGAYQYLVNLKQKNITFQKNFGQVYLGFVEVPKENLEFTLYLKKASVNGKEIEIDPKYKIYKFYLDLTKTKRKILLLFINWNVAQSFKNGKFIPALSYSFGEKPRVEELLLALDKKNEGLWVIDSALNRVVYFIEVKGKPQYLVSNWDRSEVYVLCAKDKTVKIINSKTLNIEKVFSVSPLNKPKFMDVDKNGNGVIVSQSDRKIALFDFTKGNILNLQYVEFEPGYICYIPQVQNYFISSSENAIYVFDDRLNRIKRLDTPLTPVSIFTDGENVYVSDVNGGISIYSLPSFSFEGRLNVCSLVLRGLLVRDKIYLTCDDGYIPYFYKGQRNINEFIEGKASFYALSYSSYKKWLYAGSDKENLIAVIDVYNDKIKGYIHLGGPAYEMVALP